MSSSSDRPQDRNQDRAGAMIKKEQRQRDGVQAMAEYEAERRAVRDKTARLRALRLARDPALLAAVRQKLARQRTTYPLFNTERFTRHMEAAYTAMWERSQRGEPPQSFAVTSIV